MAEEAIWFFNTLVKVRLSHGAGGDGLSLLEHRGPAGDAPPLHVHKTEDEVFHILDGDFRVRIADDERVYGPGATVLAPKGTPHTYRVESAEGRWLTITARGDFEEYVRALGRPAERDELPPPMGVGASVGAASEITSVGYRFGIDLVGGPLR